jgi:hypothetical protein
LPNALARQKPTSEAHQESQADERGKKSILSLHWQGGGDRYGSARSLTNNVRPRRFHVPLQALQIRAQLGRGLAT